MTGLLTQDELNPLQAARRVAEEHIEAIKETYATRYKAMPPRGDDAEQDRVGKIMDVITALQTIYDSVSELEFEEEQPAEPAPPDEPEEDEDEPEDEDEDEDEGEEDE